MRIDWTPGAALALDCPVCRSAEPKPLVLRADSPFPGRHRLALVRCSGCGTAFYDDLAPPAYDDPGANDLPLKFYIEQGAGIDALARLLFRFPSDRIRTYLEVGCGFGYALDLARFAFGWEVRGIDPSPMAAAGRALLGVDITPGYLTRGADLGGACFDLIVCSEVIEHVADPHHFLAGIRPILAPDGILGLTTPNAAAVQPATGSGRLLPILSPGFHLVLFTEASLRHLLEAQGFSHVRVWSTPHALHAVASDCPLTVREDPVVDRGLYRRYLAERAAATPSDTPLGIGFAGRFFKECVAEGDLDAAETAFARLAAGYQTRYGLDLRDPDAIEMRLLRAPRTFDEFGPRYPFNVAVALYCRGLLALGRHAGPGNALAHFRAAARAATAVRTALLSIGADDGETEDILWQARLQVVYCLAALDPRTAFAELDRLGTPLPGDSSPSECSRLPPRLLTVAYTRLLRELVAGRRYRDAAALVFRHRESGGLALRGVGELGRLAFAWGRRAAAGPGRSLTSRLGKARAAARTWLGRYGL